MTAMDFATRIAFDETPVSQQKRVYGRAFSASVTFAWRAVLKVKHLPEQLLDVIAIPIVFTLMFTYLFGGALAHSTKQYLQFILPGTLVMAVLLVTMYAGVGLNADMAKGVYDRFRSSPIWQPAPIVGAQIGDCVRYLLAAALVLGLGLVMGFRPGGGLLDVLAAVGLVILLAVSLSWVWTTLALVVRTPAALTGAATTLLFPLTLASNVFVDPRTMPGWLRAFVDVNPVSHLVTAVRGLMAGAPDVGEIAWVLVGCAALTAVFAPLTMRLYGTRR